LTKNQQLELDGKLEVCRNRYGFTPALRMPYLRSGLYEFTVIVYDQRTKDFVGSTESRIIVEVLNRILNTNYTGAVSDLWLSSAVL